MKEIFLKYNKMVPRYTSYPTAPHFKEMECQTTYEWLEALPEDQPISLYLHIPFCKEMCWYCGCHTTATKKYQPVVDYVSLLEKEMGLLRDKIGFTPKVSHVHFGGGSPTMMSAEDFSRIMTGMRNAFCLSEETEIAVEADPRNVTAEKVSAYKKYGVNRASFGVQDFTLDVQEAINRVQDFDVVSDAVNHFRNQGIDRLNFDLMYGLPRQSVDNLLTSIDLSLRLDPKRIALFGYAHVPWMKKHMRLIKDAELPDAEARIDQFEAASQKLQKEGFVSVGLDHFVREDDEMFYSLKEKKLARNFQGYTTDTARNLLGLGVSSISKFEKGYLQNAANMVHYREALAKDELPTVRGIALEVEDKMRADLLSDLMCYFELDVGEILEKHKFPIDYLDAEISSLEDLQKDGCLSVKGRFIQMNPSFCQMVRVVAARFDRYFIESQKRHAQAV